MKTLTLTKSSTKGMADRLRQYLANGGTTLKQTHAYEALAQCLGYPNWNTLSALLGDGVQEDEAERITVIWPWVRHALDGRWYGSFQGKPLLKHPVISSQYAKPDGSNYLEFKFPTLMQEPEPIRLPIPKLVNDDAEGNALLGIVAQALSCFIEIYVVKNWDTVAEMGHEVSNNVQWASSTLHLTATEKITFTVHAKGGKDIPEGHANLTAAAKEVIQDLRTWAGPLLNDYQKSGRPWSDLEKYGKWVSRALHAARLKLPSTTPV